MVCLISMFLVASVVRIVCCDLREKGNRVGPIIFYPVAIAVPWDMPS